MARSAITRLAVLSLALALAGCATAGPGAGRFPRSTEPVKQIVRLRGGSLGWGGVWIGSTAAEVERTLGRRLTELVSGEPDALCGYRSAGVEILGQPLRLEFEGTGQDARLQAIWLLLGQRGGPLSKQDLVRALKARFPGIEYVPNPHVPNLAEAESPSPLYRLAEDHLFWVDPQRGIYFGKVCVD
ncbi:MAG: hypothetical protein ACLGI9_20510 [Thermoanaerobaculia bacterium]